MVDINNYTEKIKTIIDVRRGQIQIENSKIMTYWNIGKEIVKAQNEDKIKYGNSYIKELSIELINLYGKGFNYTNLIRMKQFYQKFQNIATLSQYSIILPLEYLFAERMIKRF